MKSGALNVKRLAQEAPRRRIFLEALVFADGQIAVTRCSFCRWKYDGLVETGKHLFEFHMQDVHGRKVKRKR